MCVCLPMLLYFLRIDKFDTQIFQFCVCVCVCVCVVNSTIEKRISNWQKFVIFFFLLSFFKRQNWILIWTNLRWFLRRAPPYSRGGLEPVTRSHEQRYLTRIVYFSVPLAGNVATKLRSDDVLIMMRAHRVNRV